MAGKEGSFVQGKDLLLSQSAVMSRENPEQYTMRITQMDGNRGNPVKYSVKIVQMNGIETQIFVCDICQKEFRYQYALLRHFPTHSVPKGYKCDVCGKIFKQTATLQQHMAIHGEDRPFTCDVCAKSFNRISSLISHKKTHGDEKPYKCPVCKHAFHQKGNLRNHMYSHTNERPYKCPYCSKGFNQMSNLSCHKLKAHSQEEGIMFHCNICNLQFNKKAQLKAHNAEAHKQVEKASSRKSAKKNIPGNATAISTAISDAFPSEEFIVIPYVDTDAMRKVKLRNEIPFGLLNTNRSNSLLVRVYDFGEKSIIREATKKDIEAMTKIAIVAIIDEKNGEYIVKMPLKNITGEMIISGEKIFFAKQECKSDVVQNTTVLEGMVQDVFFGTTGSPTNFSNLIETIEIDELASDVPNMVKFFAETPQVGEQAIKWEMIENSFEP